jgi:hypothetical protein
MGALAFMLYFGAAFFLLFSGNAEAVPFWVINTTVNITNVPPTVNNIIVDDAAAAPANQIDLVAGGNVLVFCNATINDSNGYSDIASARAVFYDTVASSATAADNNESHYTNTSCTLSVGSGISRDASCSFNVRYYANNNTWACNMTAFDLDNANGTGLDNTVVNLLVAINVSTQVLDYGTLAPLDISNSTLENITNHGNGQIDLSVNGTDMGCTAIGTIPVTAQHYNITGSGVTYATMGELSLSSVLTTTFDLAKRTDASGDRIRETYWKIQAPVGVKGICTGNVTMAAVTG